MANLFKRRTKVIDPKTGESTVQLSRKWWGQYRDEIGRVKRVSLAQDKVAANAMLQKLVRKVELRAAGVTDCYDDQRLRPLATHTKEFIAYLRDKGSTEAYVQRTHQMLGDIVDNCNFQMIPQISASSVQSFLGNLRTDGYSVNSINHYLRAIKMFTRWLQRDHRSNEDRLSHLSCKNPETDRRRIRRPLTMDEFEWLLVAAQLGKPIQGIAGSDRTIVYLLACYTGFRRNEIGSITEQSFSFDSSPPKLSVKATYSKRRKNDVIPLRQDMALQLQQWIEARPDRCPIEPILKIANKRTGEMLSKDLAQARELWLQQFEDAKVRKKAEDSSFLQYIDSAGRYADFHALRKTFITNLSKSGASPKTAQTLARHSDINLTMNVYTDSEIGDQSIAVEALPKLPSLVPVPPSNPNPTATSGIHQHLAKLRDRAAKKNTRKNR